MKGTAAVMDSIKERIEALPGDFHVLCEDPDLDGGTRDVRITAMGGVQKFPGKALNTWETQITIKVRYQFVRPGQGQQTVWPKAITDAEDILADLYTWAPTTTGETRIQAGLANIGDDGNGYIASSRSLTVEFIRG